MQNSFRYDNLSLDFSLMFTKKTSVGWKAWNAYNEPGSLYNQPAAVEARWQKPGDNTDVQKFTTSTGSLAGVYTGYYAMMFSNNRYSDASYVRLKNVSLSYTLPVKKWLGDHTVSSCRVYVQGQNLLTFSPYKVGDPETLNYLAMPPLRTFTAGLQVKF